MTDHQIVDLNELNRIFSECRDGKDFGKFADLLGRFLGGENGQQIAQICAQCSPKRRQLFCAFEKFLQMDWQQNRFKTLSHRISGQISSSIIFPIAQKIQFSQARIWFGGISSPQSHNLVCCSSASTMAKSGNEFENDGNSSANLRLNSMPYFAIGIFLLGFQDKFEESTSVKNVAESFLLRIDAIFAASPNHFMDALLENDERCLRTMSALLRLQNCAQFSMPTMLNPLILFILLLYKIHFDSLVFIDWIDSEPELSYVFLKCFTQHLAQCSRGEIHGICENANKIPRNNETKWEIIRAEKENKSIANSDSSLNFFHFDIEELHGQQRVFKRVSVPTKSNNSICKRNEEEMPSGDHLFSALVTFCGELERKLLKLSSHLSFPAKTICQNLASIQSTIQEN